MFLQDYEHSNDNDLDTGHAAPEPEPQDEIDYALHDAGQLSTHTINCLDQKLSFALASPLL